MIEDILIVAAGKGTRLRAKGNLKPLVELGGKSLIERALATAFFAGVQRATVVTGYEAGTLIAHLNELSNKYNWHIEVLFNPDFEQPNGLSVLTAKDVLDRPFFLMMCDHVVEPELYRHFQAYELKTDQVALAIDKRLNNPYVDLEDVTRVHMDGKHIKNIGKDIETYNAFDTGVFMASPALFDAIELSGKTRNDYSISGGMKVLAANQQAIGVDIGESFWIDVDSPEMHCMAQNWLKTN